jgi:hypothetical protein
MSDLLGAHWWSLPTNRHIGTNRFLDECIGEWVLKNSFFAQMASNPLIENVYPVRENRL